MSQMLEALRLHQPLPKLASTRPVFNRAENIITACTDHATVNGHTSYQALAELYENAIRSLCAQLEAKS